MWIFLLVLAIVPLFFYLSDNIQDVLPALAPLLPQKTDKTMNTSEQTADAHAVVSAREDSKIWMRSDTNGHVAWLLSENGAYRLGVGCRTGAPLSLSLTPAGTGNAAAPIPANATLTFQYGSLPLTGGVYSGADLLAAVSQFTNVTVVVGEDANARVIAKFNPELVESGRVARNLQQGCY